MAKLTDKQQKFCDEYLIDLNATQAAIRAGYNEKTAYSMGQRLLKNVEVQKYLQQRKAERMERVEVTQDRVVKELASIAFAKATDYVTIRSGIVRIKDTDQLSDDQVRAIAGIKEGANGIEIKMNDKEKALELLGKHLGMWVDRVDLKVTPSPETVKELEAIFGTK